MQMGIIRIKVDAQQPDPFHERSVTQCNPTEDRHAAPFYQTLLIKTTGCCGAGFADRDLSRFIGNSRM
jgi:hypothetical protein